MKRILLTFALLVSTLTCSSCGNISDYLTELRTLRGTSYWTLQCSTYITTAKRFHHCGASGFYRDGCGGALTTVADFPTYQAAMSYPAQPGDVIAFHGVHVGVYVGNGQWMDSDPNHGGVGSMTPTALHNDGWFVGETKILRWKN